MKQYMIKFTFLVLTGLAFGCAELPVYESQYKTQTSAEPSQHMNGDSKMMYTVVHDTENLYLTLSTSDMMTQGRILMQGLTIWLDQDAKKNEMVGFTYPFQMGRDQSNREEMQKMNKEQRGSMDDTSSRSQKMFVRYEKAPKPIKLIGFEAPGSVQLLNTELESSPVGVQINMTDAGILTYTATIPLEFIFTNPESTEEKLSVGVFAEVPEMTQGRPERAEGQGGGGQGGPPGGGGGGQGGPPGGGGGARPLGGGQGGGMSAPEEIQFWFQVNLNKAVQ